MNERKFMHVLSPNPPKVGGYFGSNKIVEITKLIPDPQGYRFSCWVEPLKDNE